MQSSVDVGARGGTLWAHVAKSGRTYNLLQISTMWSSGEHRLASGLGQPARRFTRRLLREMVRLTRLVGMGTKAAV